MHKLAVPDWESDIDWERSEREYRAEYGPSWLYAQKRKAAIYREQRQQMSVFWRLVDYLLERLFPRFHERIYDIHVSLPPIRLYRKSKTD